MLFQKPVIDLVKKLFGEIKITGTSKDLQKIWNTMINDDKSFLKIGPRRLPFGEAQKGKLISATKRTYIGRIPKNISKAKLVFQELDGKGEVKLQARVYQRDMSFDEHFRNINNTKERKNKENEKREIYLENTADTMLYVVIKCESLTRELKYNILLKEVE